MINICRPVVTVTESLSPNIAQNMIRTLMTGSALELGRASYSRLYRTGYNAKHCFQMHQDISESTRNQACKELSLTARKMYFCQSRYASSGTVAGRKNNTKPLAKILPVKAVRKKTVTDEKKDALDLVVAYAVGEDINMKLLKENLYRKRYNYQVLDLPNDIPDVTMLGPILKDDSCLKEAFFFSDGGVVLWNMSMAERLDMVHLAELSSPNKYDNPTILQSEESIPFSSDNVTRISKKGTIFLKEDTGDKVDREQTRLQKFAMSDALSKSVTLSVQEEKLDDFIEDLNKETIKLRHGLHSNMQKKDVNMKLGEIFCLRHEINLETGYIDDPDVYWEREDLVDLYRATLSYLSVSKRISVLNERLNYCSEILQLFNNQRSDAHHVRLEWIIILLIMIEVCFECLHYAERMGYVTFAADQVPVEPVPETESPATDGHQQSE